MSEELPVRADKSITVSSSFPFVRTREVPTNTAVSNADPVSDASERLSVLPLPYSTDSVLLPVSKEALTTNDPVSIEEDTDPVAKV